MEVVQVFKVQRLFKLSFSHIYFTDAFHTKTKSAVIAALFKLNVEQQVD